MPNLDPWIKQYDENEPIKVEEDNSKFETYLLSYITECQKTIERNSHQHPTFLEHYQNVIEMIDWWTFDRENEDKGNSKNCNMCGFTS
jgi:translation initiation factor 2 beta subunit (eIF-2beta)/eIF-5